MRILILLTLIIFFSSACYRVTKIPDEVVPYYDRIYTVTKIVPTSSVTFGTLPGTIVGLCLLEKHLIILDKGYWSKASDLMKEQLIFHEVGHCDFNFHHKSGTIMGANLVPEFEYELYRNELLTEYAANVRKGSNND